MRVFPETNELAQPKTYHAFRKPQSQVMDSRYLKMQLDIGREADL